MLTETERKRQDELAQLKAQLKAAERERDSLREQVADAKNTAINYMNEASRACDEVECLRAENAALKAGKDGQQ